MRSYAIKIPEQLNRLRIFDAAAYLRKYYHAPEISLISQVGVYINSQIEAWLK